MNHVPANANELNPSADWGNPTSVNTMYPEDTATQGAEWCLTGLAHPVELASHENGVSSWNVPFEEASATFAPAFDPTHFSGYGNEAIDATEPITPQIVEPSASSVLTDSGASDHKPLFGSSEPYVEKYDKDGTYLGWDYVSNL